MVKGESSRQSSKILRPIHDDGRHAEPIQKIFQVSWGKRMGLVCTPAMPGVQSTDFSRALAITKARLKSVL